MSSRKVNTGIYIVGGTLITAGMVTIKFIGWVAHKAVITFLLHQ